MRRRPCVSTQRSGFRGRRDCGAITARALHDPDGLRWTRRRPVATLQRVYAAVCRGCGGGAAGASEAAANLLHMDTFTIREAADACGLTYEALRARVDRGTIRAGKRREDAARVIPKSELQRVGLLPGDEHADLHAEIVRLREELQAHRLLAERAQGETAVEREARERIEQALHQERAERQMTLAEKESVEGELREAERARAEAEAERQAAEGKAEAEAQVAAELRKLECRLAEAGFFERRRLLRELRSRTPLR